MLSVREAKVTRGFSTVWTRLLTCSRVNLLSRPPRQSYLHKWVLLICLLNPVARRLDLILKNTVLLCPVVYRSEIWGATDPQLQPELRGGFCEVSEIDPSSPAWSVSAKIRASS